MDCYLYLLHVAMVSEFKFRMVRKRKWIMSENSLDEQIPLEGPAVKLTTTTCLTRTLAVQLSKNSKKLPESFFFKNSTITLKPFDMIASILTGGKTGGVN